MKKNIKIYVQMLNVVPKKKENSGNKIIFFNIFKGPNGKNPNFDITLKIKYI